MKPAVAVASLASSLLALAVACLLAAALPAAAQSLPCGESPRDWCPAPAGDPCGRHRNVTACRADPACHGLPYRGESVVACILDERGFGTNCPTVGCTSTLPPKPGG